jgi:mycoredoxin
MSNVIRPDLFGASWCEKTSALKEFLEIQNVGYNYYDIDNDAEAEEKVKKLNAGQVKIPVVIIKNAVLRNPSISFLDQKLVENGILDPQ